MRLSRITSTLRSIVALVRDTELSFLAGSIAFFAFFSLLPALLLVIMVGSLLGGEQFAAQLTGLFETYLSEEGSILVGGTDIDKSGQVGVSVVGVVALLWSALKVFRAIDLAFDRVYGEESGPSLLEQLLDGAIVLVAIGLGMVTMLVLRWLVLRLAPGLAERAVLGGAAVFVAGLLVILGPLYYVMPPQRVSVRNIVPGTIVALCGLVALESLFAVYTSLAGQYQTYGLLGAVLLFLLWLYFSALVLLLGAVVNAVIEE